MLRSTELPCLPGYSFNYNMGQTKFPRVQYCTYLGGKIPYLTERGLTGEETSKFPSIYAKGEVTDLPTWLVYDKQILAFDAYYLDNIYEGGLYQNYMVHSCKICYFLEDGTIQVFEKPVNNSGLPQGCIIRRQKIRIPGNGNSTDFYDMIDLNIGREIEFFGKVFKITNCDMFTRRFLNKLGIPVPEPMETPKDPYLELRSMEGKKKKKMKGQVMKNMLAVDNRILTFLAYWDDNGNLHRLKVLYFLADGTIEIRDVTNPEKSCSMVKRGKFPKEMELHLPGPGADEPVTLLNVLGPSNENSRSVVDPLALGAPDKDYYTDRDLTIGSVLASYGRRFVIYDMDPFTKEYYHIRYGLEDIHPLEVPKSNEELALEKGGLYRPVTPPHNGFGSYEDSLHNVRHIIPEGKVRHWHRDPEKEPLGYDSKILRFGALLVEDNLLVLERKFIISYYLLDGTISVYEIPFANSGRDGGVILRRRKVYLPGQSMFSNKPPIEVPLEEFYLGNRVVLENSTFQIMQADEYTLNYMGRHPNEFPKNNIRTILEKIREEVRGKYKQWAAPFIQHGTPVPYNIYRDSLKEVMGNKITDHEILALARHFNQSPVIEKIDKENLRGSIHDDLRRFLFSDFARLGESFLHMDKQKTGLVSQKDAYSTLRGARLPIPPQTLSLLVDMFVQKGPDGKFTGVNYKELIEFLNYGKHQVPSVVKDQIKEKYGTLGVNKILLVDVKGIIDELHLEEDLKKESL